VVEHDAEGDPLGVPGPERPLCHGWRWRKTAYNRGPMSESQPPPDVVFVDSPLSAAELRRLVAAHFEDMVKYVVDVHHGVAAVGGELHADEEALLLERGSRQEDLWGANYYPGEGEEGCIEFTSLINIRPSQGNRSMLIEDEGIRARVREVTFSLIGRGEPLD